MSNIIEVYPIAGKTANTAQAWQYDYGQTLHINGLELPASYKAEFSNATRGDAIPTVQTTDEIVIPAQFLESGASVYIWLVVVDAESRTTEYALIVPVAARAKPSDQEPAPEEQSEIDQAIAALNHAVEQTAADVDTAGGYADDARLSAEAAATASENTIAAKTTAETKASEAAESASSASALAQNASSSASFAATAKEAAESAKTAAETKASEAAESASTASTAAQNAGTSAHQADISAQNASSSASSAATAKEAAVSAKNAAEAKASEAAGSASAASTSAQNASASASQANSSAQAAAGSASVAASAKQAAESAKSAAQSAAESVAGAMDSLEATIQADLRAAKESGMFDGEDGHTPVKDVDYFDGDDGVTFTPHISEQGVLSWTNDGGLPNPAPKNIKGEPGTGVSVHVCSSSEYDVSTRVPTVQHPESNTFYLVPAENAASPDMFVEWIYTNSAWEMFGSATVEVPVTDVQVNGVSVLSNGVANVPISNASTYGVVKSGIYGIDNNNGELRIKRPTDAELKSGDGTWRVLNPAQQHQSTFYGLAKAAGDATQSQSSNPVGTYTDDAKSAIRTMLGAGKVDDVQVNGTSVVTGGVANVPIASSSSPGVFKTGSTSGTGLYLNPTSGILFTSPADASELKAGTNTNRPVVPSHSHESTFYGLAKAAGADMKDIAGTTVGTYPDTQKEAIQSMLGISQMLAPTNPNLVATQAYAIGDVFAANGHLYKATAAIAQDEAIIPDTNCVETTMAEAGGKIKDVQIAGSSVVGSDGVAAIPTAGGSSNKKGVVWTNGSAWGIRIYESPGWEGALAIIQAEPNIIKGGNNGSFPITSMHQHDAVFYGLSKLAGVDLANETVTLGTYPEASKTAIKEMLGVQDGLKVVRLI